MTYSRSIKFILVLIYSAVIANPSYASITRSAISNQSIFNEIVSYFDAGLRISSHVRSFDWNAYLSNPVSNNSTQLNIENIESSNFEDRNEQYYQFSVHIRVTHEGSEGLEEPITPDPKNEYEAILIYLFKGEEDRLQLEEISFNSDDLDDRFVLVSNGNFISRTDSESSKAFAADANGEHQTNLLSRGIVPEQDLSHQFSESSAPEIQTISYANKSRSLRLSVEGDNVHVTRILVPGFGASWEYTIDLSTNAITTTYHSTSNVIINKEVAPGLWLAAANSISDIVTKIQSDQSDSEAIASIQSIIDRMDLLLQHENHISATLDGITYDVDIYDDMIRINDPKTFRTFVIDDSSKVVTSTVPGVVSSYALQEPNERLFYKQIVKRITYITEQLIEVHEHEGDIDSVNQLENVLVRINSDPTSSPIKMIESSDGRVSVQIDDQRIIASERISSDRSYEFDFESGEAKTSFQGSLENIYTKDDDPAYWIESIRGLKRVVNRLLNESLQSDDELALNNLSNQLDQELISYSDYIFESSNGENALIISGDYVYVQKWYGPSAYYWIHAYNLATNESQTSYRGSLGEIRTKADHPGFWLHGAYGVRALAEEILTENPQVENNAELLKVINQINLETTVQMDNITSMIEDSDTSIGFSIEGDLIIIEDMRLLGSHPEHANMVINLDSKSITWKSLGGWSNYSWDDLSLISWYEPNGYDEDGERIFIEVFSDRTGRDLYIEGITAAHLATKDAIEYLNKIGNLEEALELQAVFDSLQDELRYIENPNFAYLSFFEQSAHPETGMPLSHIGSTDVFELSFTYDVALYILAGGEFSKEALDHLMLRSNPAQNDPGMVRNLTYDPQRGIYNDLKHNGVWAPGFNRWNVHVGPNAWIGIAALNEYVKTKNEDYLDFARERANFIIDVESTYPSDGGVVMGPEMQFCDGCSFAEIKSTENNLSALLFYDGLFEVTGETTYRDRADSIWAYLKTMYDSESHTFLRGERLVDGEWIKDTVSNYAMDTTSWIPLERVLQDNLFGLTVTDRLAEVEQMILAAENLTGVYSSAGDLLGMSFSPLSQARSVISIEWSAQFALLYLKVAHSYQQIEDSDKFTFYFNKYTSLMASIQSFYKEEDDTGNLIAPYAVYSNGQGAYSEPTGHGFTTPLCSDCNSSDKEVYSVATLYTTFALDQADPTKPGLPHVSNIEFVDLEPTIEIHEEFDNDNQIEARWITVDDSENDLLDIYIDYTFTVDHKVFEVNVYSLDNGKKGRWLDFYRDSNNLFDANISIDQVLREHQEKVDKATDYVDSRVNHDGVLTFDEIEIARQEIQSAYNNNSNQSDLDLSDDGVVGLRDVAMISMIADVINVSGNANNSTNFVLDNETYIDPQFESKVNLNEQIIRNQDVLTQPRVITDNLKD